MSQVAVEMTADERKLWAALQRVTAQQNKLSAAARETGEVSRKASDGATRGLDQTGKSGRSAAQTMTAGFKTFALGLVGAGGALAALRLITAELQAQRELQKEVAKQQITLSGARAEVIRNLAGMTQDQTQEVLAKGEEIAKSAAMPERIIQQAMAQALSASGLNVELSAAAVERSAQFLPDQPEAIAGYAGALIDLSKVTGQLDATINQGLLAYVAGLSRVAQPEFQARAIPQALIGQRAMGATTAEAGALFASLSNAMADIEGRMSATAAIALAEQLRGVVPEVVAGQGQAAVEAGKAQIDAQREAAREQITARPEGAPPLDEAARTAQEQELTAMNAHFDAQIAALTAQQQAQTAAFAQQWAGMTMGQRIGQLQAQPELARGFLDAASFEKKALGPVEQLLTDATSNAAQEFRKGIAEIPADFAALAAAADQMLANVRGDPLFGVAQVGRELAATADQLRSQDLVRGVAGATREGLQDLLKSAGFGPTAQKTAEAIFDVQTGMGTRDALEPIIDELRRREKALAEPQAEFVVGGIGAAPVYIPPRPPSVEELQIAKSLGALADSLEPLREQLNRQIGEQRQRIGVDDDRARAQFAPPAGPPAPTPQTGPTPMDRAAERLESSAEKLDKAAENLDRRRVPATLGHPDRDR